MAKFDGTLRGCYDRTAGWSSLVARWAHNPKVGGSNPPPATMDATAENAVAFAFFATAAFVLSCGVRDDQAYPDSRGMRSRFKCLENTMSSSAASAFADSRARQTFGIFVNRYRR
jgi:hypothetical protein